MSAPGSFNPPCRADLLPLLPETRFAARTRAEQISPIKAEQGMLYKDYIMGPTNILKEIHVCLVYFGRH